jgi:Site-specific recombinase XerD
MTFLDSLQDSFSKMIAYREAFGYATTTYVSTVTPFINYCGGNYPEATAVTKEMVDSWLESYGYKTNTQAAFIACLRQYMKFINFLGMRAFVPDEDYTVRRVSYEPYSFTDLELETLFDSFDEYRASTSNKKFRPELVVSPIFRMMYCCGMRPSEPLGLLCSDVNLGSGDIYIRESKRHKDRHIIMSGDMRRLCSAYHEKVGVRTWFFEYAGKPYETHWMTAQFHHCWRHSGLQAHGSPHPYDLRHAFATRNLMKWIDRKLDAMTLLPFLSMYMGHSDISSTLYYVHLLPERIRKSAGIDWEQFAAIYGKDGGPDES